MRRKTGRKPSVHRLIGKGDTVRLRGSKALASRGEVLGVRAGHAAVEFKGRRVTANLPVGCVGRV